VDACLSIKRFLGGNGVRAWVDLVRLPTVVLVSSS
jgi:hypothetical protein